MGDKIRNVRLPLSAADAKELKLGEVVGGMAVRVGAAVVCENAESAHIKVFAVAVHGGLCALVGLFEFRDTARHGGYVRASKEGIGVFVKRTNPVDGEIFRPDKFFHGVFERARRKHFERYGNGGGLF